MSYLIIVCFWMIKGVLKSYSNFNLHKKSFCGVPSPTILTLEWWWCWWWGKGGGGGVAVVGARSNVNCLFLHTPSPLLENVNVISILWIMPICFQHPFKWGAHTAHTLNNYDPFDHQISRYFLHKTKQRLSNF